MPSHSQRRDFNKFFSDQRITITEADILKSGVGEFEKSPFAFAVRRHFEMADSEMLDAGICPWFKYHFFRVDVRQRVCVDEGRRNGDAFSPTSERVRTPTSGTADASSSLRFMYKIPLRADPYIAIFAADEPLKPIKFNCPFLGMSRWI